MSRSRGPTCPVNFACADALNAAGISSLANLDIIHEVLRLFRRDVKSADAIARISIDTRRTPLVEAFSRRDSATFCDMRNFLRPSIRTRFWPACRPNPRVWRAVRSGLKTLATWHIASPHNHNPFRRRHDRSLVAIRETSPGSGRATRRRSDRGPNNCRGRARISWREHWAQSARRKAGRNSRRRRDSDRSDRGRHGWLGSP